MNVKIAILALGFFSMISTGAVAAAVCTGLPPAVTADMKPNFDGSVTFNNPKVLVNGEYQSLHSIGYTEEGWCQLVGKGPVADYEVGELKEPRMLVELYKNGSYLNSGNSVIVLKRIVCK